MTPTLFQRRDFVLDEAMEEEHKIIDEAVPASTRNKNKWAMKLFRDWSSQRENKLPNLEDSTLSINLESLQSLDEDMATMTPESLNFWIGKCLQEVTGKDGQRYPGKTLYQIVAALKRSLES